MPDAVQVRVSIGHMGRGFGGGIRIPGGFCRVARTGRAELPESMPDTLGEAATCVDNDAGHYGQSTLEMTPFKVTTLLALNSAA